jgi:O-antigen/teichoic acid export membrane protein
MIDGEAPRQDAIAEENERPISDDGTTILAIRGGALRVLGYAGGVLVSLGAAAILLRQLGISGFGRYVTVTSLIALVGGVTEAGIVVYGIREFVVRDEQDRRQLMGNLLAMRLTLGLVGVGCAACFGIAIGYGNALVLGTLIAGAGLLAQVVADVLSIPLQAQLRLGRLTVVDLSRRVVTLALVALVAALGAGLLSFLAVSTIATVAALVLMAWIVRRYSVRLSFDWAVWRALFAETLPYAIALSIAVVYFYVTVILMSLIATPTQTGLFATSFRVTQVVIAIPGLLLTAVFPLLSRVHRKQEGDPGVAVGKVFIVAIVCGVWMSLAIALGASFIVPLIAGSQGRGAVPVLRIQGLVLIGSFVSTSSALTLVSLRRYRSLIVVSSCSLALNIVLGLVLVPAVGAEGGALADVLTETIAAAGLTVVLMRAVSEHQITASFVPAVMLACVVSAGVLLLPIGAVAQVIGASALYLGTLLVTRTIPAEVVDAARRFTPMGALRQSHDGAG